MLGLIFASPHLHPYLDDIVFSNVKRQRRGAVSGITGIPPPPGHASPSCCSTAGRPHRQGLGARRRSNLGGEQCGAVSELADA